MRSPGQMEERRKIDDTPTFKGQEKRMNLHKRSGRNNHLDRKKSKRFSWKPNLKSVPRREWSALSNIADRSSKNKIRDRQGKEGGIDDMDNMDEGKGLTEVVWERLGELERQHISSPLRICVAKGSKEMDDRIGSKAQMNSRFEWLQKWCGSTGVTADLVRKELCFARFLTFLSLECVKRVSNR